jgi:hypothetical protein
VAENAFLDTPNRVSRGESAGSLLPLLYRELRRLAHAMKGRRPDATLQTTAPVYEAYLKLVGKEDPGWNGRAHFFGAAARAMREILVDEARRKGRIKRGGGPPDPCAGGPSERPLAARRCLVAVPALPGRFGGPSSRGLGRRSGFEKIACKLRWRLEAG